MVIIAMRHSNCNYSDCYYLLDWIFPQLLLEATSNFYGKANLASGQMRIAFTKGKDDLLSGGVLLGSSEPYRTMKMCTNPNTIHLSDDFQTFSLEWKPGLSCQSLVSNICKKLFNFQMKF